MAEVVYVLCAVTSLVCTVLLVRSYRSSRTRLLLWSACCFFGLALNNALLIVDIVIARRIDLSILRSSIALVAIGLLLYGLVNEDERGTQ